MKLVLLASLLLVGCATTPRPPAVVSKDYAAKNIVLKIYADEPESRPLAQNEANTFCNGEATLASEANDMQKKANVIYGGAIVPVQHKITLLTFKCQ